MIFKGIFSHLVVCCFQLADEDSDGRINFKEFTQLFEKMCSSEISDIMKLLYRMHLPPALTLEELSKLQTVETDSYDIVENAGENDIFPPVFKNL